MTFAIYRVFFATAFYTCIVVRELFIPLASLSTSSPLYPVWTLTKQNLKFLETRKGNKWPCWCYWTLTQLEQSPRPRWSPAGSRITAPREGAPAPQTDRGPTTQEDSQLCADIALFCEHVRCHVHEPAKLPITPFYWANFHGFVCGMTLWFYKEVFGKSRGVCQMFL